MGCDIHLYLEKKVDNKEWAYIEEGDVGRDYDLFGFLAGVRGYKEEQHFERKGLPDDMSAEVQKECNDYGSDGHSHSWLTLKELHTVDWNSDTFMIKKSGIMNNDQWEKFQDTVKAGKPDFSLTYPYWGAGGDEKTSSYHEWEVPIREEFKTFYDKVVQRLPACCIYCRPDELRIVFWFDN